ncbi:MAG: hypothetical protein ACJ8EL_08910 [Rhizomicrobium sp.]|jgi:hypothetical protein
MSVPDVLGLVGSAIVIVAYFAVAHGRLPADGRHYYVSNLAGAGLIFVSLLWAWNLPAAVVEIFWAAISAYGLLRAAMLRSSPRPR